MRLGSLECKDSRALLGIQDHQVRWDFLEVLDRLETLVYQVLQDSALQEQLAHPEVQDLQALWVHRVNLDLREELAGLDLKAAQVKLMFAIDNNNNNDSNNNT